MYWFDNALINWSIFWFVVLLIYLLVCWCTDLSIDQFDLFIGLLNCWCIYWSAKLSLFWFFDLLICWSSRSDDLYSFCWFDDLLIYWFVYQSINWSTFGPLIHSSVNLLTCWTFDLFIYWSTFSIIYWSVLPNR